MGDFYNSVFQFTEPLLCISLSPVDSLYYILKFQLLYSSDLFGFSLCFLTLLKSSLYSYILLLSSLSISVIITLSSLLRRLLISTLFSSSSEICLVPLFGTYSSVSSFCLILCVYFYVLGRSVTFSDLVEVALCRRHPMEPSSTLPSGHKSCMF